jgi:hypothetical protein
MEFFTMKLLDILPTSGSKSKRYFLLKLIKIWDWKVHVGFYLIGFLYHLLSFILIMNSQGRNPFEDSFTLLLIPFIGGFYFLFFDFIAFWVLVAITRRIYGDWPERETPI